MKLKLLVLLFLSFVSLAQAQESKEIQKPQRVYILNDSSIVTESEVKEIAQSGYVKNLVSGATDEERKRYQEKFGDVIGDNFIARIYTLTEAEKKEKEGRSKEAIVEKPAGASKNSHALKVNDKAKEFKVELVDGTFVKMSDLKGKVVMLNFWATWCQPCIMEFYELPEKILQKYDPKDFVFLTISRGEPKEKVQKTLAKLKEKGIDFNSGIDPNEEIWKLYGEEGIPLNFIIDRQGVIRHVSIGYGETQLDEMSEKIRKLIN
ncbi:TlpA family protein disulfide reductase [Pontibacter virosus]|uniref:Peroxiredoxin n=1 Tax=Pontibacter virosus TaxID=1765052 RepID=A0A2U1B5B4_9BACT|nr:TlpA disulfide reductase family protein [Pontibacter virosus]PVY43865.1 peroxiredoxin [Pontibacter virosus]